MFSRFRIFIFIFSYAFVFAGCSMYEFKDPTGAQLQVQYVSPEDKGKKIMSQPQKETDKKITYKSQIKPATSEIEPVPEFKVKSRPNDIAVIVGIEEYQDLPKSDFSSSDAKLIRNYLKALGFQERNIEVLINEKATKSGIEKAIEAWLPNHVKADSKVFIYYSGHGAPEPKTGDAYIVPYDGDPNYLDVTGYSLKRLYEKLAKLRATEVIVVLDSCFSGIGGRSVLAKGARPLVIMSDMPMISKNMVVISASQGNQISTSSPELGHGIFTYYFLKALKEGKKAIVDIYQYVKPLVEDEAKRLNINQSPNITPDIEKLKGKFYLR